MRGEQARPREDFFSRLIGRSRYVVLLAVAAVLLVAFSLFLLGAIEALTSIWQAWTEVVAGNLDGTDAAVESLELVSLMLKAVVFYLIGVGLYSLFIAPLNLTVSLGVETLSDLESKVASVVVVILGVTFLEHFIRWEEPLETLQFGAALGLVAGALVLFQQYNHRVKEDQKSKAPEVQTQAQRRLFVEEEETQTIEETTTPREAREAGGDGREPR